MELRMLRYFLAVVREENISRAAERLHITQPTLSRQMAQLEEDAGTQLFVRGKYLQLTDAGMILRHRAEEVVQLMDKIADELREQEEPQGVINIGCGGQKAVAFVLECLDEFQRIHPKVAYYIYTNSADNIKEKLESGLLDFGVLLEPVDMAKYDYIRLDDKDRWGLLTSAKSPLAKKEYISVKDIASVPIIMTNRESLHTEIRHWLGNEVDALKIAATHNILKNAASIVEKGRVCALTIEGAVSLYDPLRLVFRPLTPELSTTSVLAWKKFRTGYGLAEKFLKYFELCLTEHFAKYGAT